LEEIGDACSLDVTVGQIAKRAGVSSALAHHYFGGKEDLFLATLRMLLEVFRKDIVSALKAAQTPRERLSAIVGASFAPMQFSPATVAAWTIFYVKAQASPSNARLLAVYVARLRSNLRHELRQLVRETEIDDAAEAIAAMIDGLYLRQGVRKEPANRMQAIAVTERVIDDLIGVNRPVA